MFLNWAVLNWIDWSIIVVLTASSLLSLWRGFVREAASLVGWIAAFILANLYAERLALLLVDVIDNPGARYVAAFAIILVGVLLLSNVVGMLLAQLVRLTGLGLLDRMLGTIFGFTRGIIILLVVIFFVRELLPTGAEQALQESQLMPHLELLMQWVQSMFGKMTISTVPTLSI